MPKLKRLRAKDIERIFYEFGFRFVSQNSSHMKFSRQGVIGKEILLVPKHRALDLGTVQGVFKQAKKYIDEDKLFPYFYTES